MHLLKIFFIIIMIFFENLIQIENLKNTKSNYVSKLIKHKIQGMLKMSSKNAATKGTTK